MMAAVVAVPAIALAGAALTSLCAFRGAFRAATALLIGLGVWSATYAACLFAFGAAPGVRIAKDALLALAGAATLWLRARSRPGAPWRSIEERAPRWVTASLIVAAGVATAAFIEHVLRYPDGGWDAWMIWNLRARFLARAGDGFRAAFSPEMLFWVHQDYPLLLPGVVAQGFLAVGSQPLWLPAAAAYGFAALCVCLLGAGVAAARGSNSGLLAALVLLATPCFAGFAANEQSDVPLACFVLAACAISAWAIETGAPRDLLLAGLAASLGAWTKNEGAVHLASLLVALLLVRWAPFPKRLRGILWFVVGALPVLVLLGWFKLRVASPNDLLQGSPGSLLDAHRWVALAIELPRRLVFFQNWGLWLAAELALVIALVRWHSPPASARLVGVAAIVSLVATAIVYVLQPHELVWFVRASADRVLIQLWPAIVFATFLSLTPAAAQEAR